MLSTSSTTTLGITAPVGTTYSAPALMSAMTQNKWAAMGTDSLSNHDPCNYTTKLPFMFDGNQKDIFVSWNGGAVSQPGVLTTKGTYHVWGGGHTNAGGYGGNELYTFDFSLMLWTRTTNPYPTPTTVSNSLGEEADGSPCATHNYCSAQFDPVNKRFINGRSSNSCTESAGGPALVHMWDFNTNTWLATPVSTIANGNISAGDVGNMSIWDTTRNCMWFYPIGTGNNNPSIVKLDSLGTRVGAAPSKIYGAWTLGQAGVNAAFTYLSSGYDPVHDLFVYADFYGGSFMRARSMTALGTRVTLNIDPTSDAGYPSETKGGLEWSNALSAFIWYRGGQDVWKFKLVSGAWNTGLWKWTKISSATQTTYPIRPTSDNGCYNRFRIMAYDDGEWAVISVERTLPMYAFRLTP